MADIASPLQAAYGGPVATLDQVADTASRLALTAAERAQVAALKSVAGVTWLAAEVFDQPWTAAEIAIAKAIKSISIIGYGVSPSETYYIAAFAKDDGVYGDQIIIRRASDGSSVASAGTAVITKSTDGLTRRVLTSSTGIQITLEIAYGELSAGLLLNMTDTTRLIIDKAAAPANRARIAAAGLRARNIAFDSAGALATGVYQSAGATPAQAAAGAALTAYGVVRSHPVGTGTSATALYKRDLLPANVAGKYAFVSAFVSSADGVNWPGSQLSPYVYSAASGGSIVAGIAEKIGGYIQISATVRWYWARAKLPTTGSLASLVYGLDSVASGSACEIGGWTVAISEGPLLPEAVNRVDWTGYTTRDSWRDGVEASLAPLAGLPATVADHTASISGLTTRADKLRRGQRPWSNSFPNGNNDPLEAAPIWINGSSIVDPASSEMVARGIKKAVNVGTGGSHRLRDALILDASASGQYYVASIYVYSADGVTWPAPGAYWYVGATGAGGGVMPTYIQLDASTRLYYVTGQLPLRTDLTTVRIGVVAAVSGVVAQIGGWSFVRYSRPLTIDDIMLDDWYPQATRQEALLDIQRTVDATLSLPFAGETWVYFGDSITESYGVPAALATLTGATVINGGFGGCRWTPRITSSEPDVYTNEMSMVRLAECIRTGNWTPLLDAADDLFTFNGDDNRPQAAALAAVNYATVDRIFADWGTNDWSAGRTIGAPNSASEYDLRGGINLSISRILSVFPSIELALVTPWWRGPAATGGDSNINPNSGGVYLSDVQDAIMAGGKYNQVAVMPMHERFGANLANKDELLHDDLHPTTAGATRKAKLLSAWARSVWRS